MTDTQAWLYLSDYIEKIHPKRRAGLPGKIREGVQLGVILAFPTADLLKITYTKPNNSAGERDIHDYAFKDTPEARDWLAGFTTAKAGPGYLSKEQLSSGRFDFEAEAKKYAKQVKRKKGGSPGRSRDQEPGAPAGAAPQEGTPAAP